jgi:hypothetical protein
VDDAFFAKKKKHRPPSLPSLPTMKSNIQVVGMNATSTR